jgi:hypothetical protein
MRKERKHFNAEEKVAILRRHLLDKVPVSDLCEELACGQRCSTAGGWRRLGSSGRFVSKPVWTTAELASCISVLATKVDAHSPVQKPSTHTLTDSEG